MHISIFWFLLIAAPVSVSAALLACSFLSLKTLKGRVFYNLARGNNLPVYLCITALIFAYAIWENDQLIRLAVLMSLTLFLYAVVKNLRLGPRFRSSIDMAFWLHAALILLSVVIDKPLLLGGNEVPGRFGGLIGYDFVPFFFSSYLIMQLYEDGEQVRRSTYIKLIAGAVVIILSGRFGLVHLAIVSIYFLCFNRSIQKVTLALTGGLLFLYLFSDKLLYSILSFQMFFKGLMGTQIDYLVLISPDGSYGLSFNPLIAEFYALGKVSIAPSFAKSFPVMDSGVVNTLVAGGWVLGSYVILLYGKFLNFSKVHTGFLSAILLVTDLKFRCFYSPFVMLWFFLMLNKMSIENRHLLKK